MGMTRKNYPNTSYITRPWKMVRRPSYKSSIQKGLTGEASTELVESVGGIRGHCREFEVEVRKEREGHEKVRR